MFINSKIMGASVPGDIRNPFKLIQDGAKKFNAEQIIRLHPEYCSAMVGLSQDIDLLEQQVLRDLASARARLKAGDAARAKLTKDLAAMKAHEKALDKHATAALKALKSGDLAKLPGIAKKATSDGAKYLKLLKTTTATAKTLSDAYEESRKIMTKTQAVAVSLRASQVKLTPLTP